MRVVLTITMVIAGGCLFATAQNPSDLVSMLFPPPDYLRFPLVRPLLSELRQGESLELRITTWHCNGGNTYALRFVGPAPFRVVVRGRSDAAVDGPLPFIGETPLSKADALRVDRVLAFYRSGPQSICTTQSVIGAEWRTAGGSKSESWSDGSCSVEDSDLSLSPYTVATRANAAP
jgi:hypothetical protein